MDNRPKVWVWVAIIKNNKVLLGKRKMWKMGVVWMAKLTRESFLTTKKFKKTMI